ncbi:hypothetical protein ES703_115224 [subsurface metagenome]
MNNAHFAGWRLCGRYVLCSVRPSLRKRETGGKTCRHNTYYQGPYHSGPWVAAFIFEDAADPVGQSFLTAHDRGYKRYLAAGYQIKQRFCIICAGLAAGYDPVIAGLLA